MTVTVEINGTVACIALSGGVDYATQEEFKQANNQALSTDNITEIRVDFAMVTFLDSAGIRALIALHRETSATGKSLILLNCNEQIRQTLKIGGFDQMFTFQ